MTDLRHNSIRPDEWEQLKTFTQARIALGRTGVSVPLRESLAFRLAHAHAKDAVYSSLNTPFFIEKFQENSLPFLLLHSKASDRDEYLKRPDLGRSLRADSRSALEALASNSSDLVIIIADGLSASAVNTQAWPMVASFQEQARARGYTFAPLMLAQQARVALSDEIGTLLRARMVVQLIGERPGLSASDSMGIYLTYAPKPGLTDERRNCISNIRPQGLSVARAIDQLLALVDQAFRLEISGISLKDDFPPGTESLK